MEALARTPRDVAEYFAWHTQEHLGPILGPGVATLERIQALLFLGFHRWTDLKGETGWYYINVAVIWAHRLGFHRLDVPAIPGEVRRPASASTSLEDRSIDREIERRTYWSCFILDRFSGCLKDRPHSINVNEIHTQLPCSDSAFIDGSKVKTRHILESDDEYAERRAIEDDEDESVKSFGCGGSVVWEVETAESELALYIPAVNHFGNVMTWSIQGGRR